MIVTSVGTPRSAGENSWRTWEHLGVLATSLGAPATTLAASRITVEQSGKNIFFGNGAGAPGNHSYYISLNYF